MDLEKRLGLAERQLAFVQSFFSRVDARMTALFAIVTGQAAFLASSIHAVDFKDTYSVVATFSFMLMAAIATHELYQCAYPNLKGGERSLVYFSEIAKLREVEFLSEYTAVSEQKLLEDIVGQIWRNSQILSAKYVALKRATIAVGIGVAPWLIAIGKLSYNYGHLPALGKG
jgi:hypothetical protein